MKRQLCICCFDFIQYCIIHQPKNLPTNGVKVHAIEYIQTEQIPKKAMPGVILFPDKPYIFNQTKDKKMTEETFTMTLYRSYPITIMVIIDAVPNKAPANP